MPLEYEEGFVPRPGFLDIYHLKTSKVLGELVGKTIKDIKYPEDYSSILIIFTDGTELEIRAEDCFDFIVEINRPESE